MKTIGIIGGLGPESTKMYYDKIVNQYRIKAGGQYPEIIIYSVNMEEMKKYLETKDLDTLTKRFSKILEVVIQAGADFVAIASNSPHIVFDRLKEKVKVPLISIVEESARHSANQTLNKKAGLLGTGFTMKADFFPKTFSRFGMNLYVPDEDDQQFIHEKIFSELAFGVANETTRRGFIGIVEKMVAEHSIDTVVLGCTELPLIFDKEYLGLKYIDTVEVHVSSIVDFCFNV